MQSTLNQTAPALSIKGVTKHFSTLKALNGVDLTVEQGEFFGLLGPNGAGKTTLISIIAGLSTATSGQVAVMGHDVRTDFRAARQSLGLVPQELVFDPFFTVKEFLRNQSGYFGIKNNDEWIDEMLLGLGLADKANTNMRALSGGMKRRVLIAQALVHKPPVIVLDEPTAGVDVELRQTLWKFIRKLHVQGHTIILTTHYLEEAEELCGRIALLQHGQLVALDTTSNLLGQCSGLQLLLRINGSLPDALKPLLVQGSGSVAGERLRLRLSHYDAAVDILNTVRAHQLVIDELEIQRADLEDVFLQIVGTKQAQVNTFA
jgi:ABC-2 type transport system ATP-binding protein